MSDNKKNNIKLSALSNIDDELINESTKKRIALIFGKKKKRKKPSFIIIPIAAVISVMITLLILLPILGLGKQVPVYTGMTVSGTVPENEALSAPEDYVAIALSEGKISITPVLSEQNAILYGNGNGNANGYDNGNANGHRKHPLETDVNLENKLENKIESSLKVQGAAEEIYYTKANTDFYITVHVDNPDDFEIQSFTLNGEKYANYMFEEGSDMENLILKCNAGDAEGIIEYTLDNIKYIDGTEIKDVKLEADKTVKVGVATSKIAKATLTNEKITVNSFAAKVKLTDSLTLIEMSGGKAMAMLYDGKELIFTKEITVGEETEIIIEGLTPNTPYIFAVGAMYDDLSGNGIGEHILYKNAFYTLPLFNFDNVEITQTGISFSHLWDSSANEKILTSLALYKGNEKISDMDIDATSAEGLLSNNEYSLKATYMLDGKENSTVYTFTTLAKAKPAYKIVNDVCYDTSISFDISETDVDNIGEVTKIELLRENGAPITAPVGSSAEFTGLDSASKYTVRITYTYDLNDGNGVQTDTVEKTAITLAMDITVTDIQINGTDNVITVGAVSTLIIYVDNPDNVEIKNFVINGSRISATEFGSNSYILKCVSLSEGGKEYPACTEVVYALYSKNIKQTVNYTDADSITILGDVNVISIAAKDNETEFVTTEVEEYGTGGVNITVILKLSGADLYDVKSVTLYNGSEKTLTKIDGETYSFIYEAYLAYDILAELKSIVVKGITYGYGEATLTKNFAKPYSIEFLVTQPDKTYLYGGVTEISTVEELLAMNSHGRYRLVNDIDLTGVAWKSLSCVELDGNGYSLKNLTISAINPKADINIISNRGNSADGDVIHNLKFENLKVSVSTDKNSIMLIETEIAHNVVIEGEITIIYNGTDSDGGWRIISAQYSSGCVFSGLLDVRNSNEGKYLGASHLLKNFDVAYLKSSKIVDRYIRDGQWEGTKVYPYSEKNDEE